MKRSGLLHRALRTALVVALGAGCLVGGFRVAAGCWIGRDCGVVSESASVPQTVLLSRDELTVTVEGPRPCSGGFHLTATEQSDRVVLSGVVTSPRRPVACHGAMMNASWPVHLRTPLGDRPLIDAATGRPIRWVGGRTVLEPSYLPMAYKRHDVKLGLAPGTDPTHADMCYIQSFYSDRAGLAILDCPPAGHLYAVSGADATGSPERAATLVTVANGLR